MTLEELQSTVAAVHEEWPEEVDLAHLKRVLKLAGMTLLHQVIA
jgi:hypothetical protein